MSGTNGTVVIVNINLKMVKRRYLSIGSGPTLTGHDLRTPETPHHSNSAEIASVASNDAAASLNRFAE